MSFGDSGVELSVIPMMFVLVRTSASLLAFPGSHSHRERGKNGESVRTATASGERPGSETCDERGKRHGAAGAGGRSGVDRRACHEPRAIERHPCRLDLPLQTHRPRPAGVRASDFNRNDVPESESPSKSIGAELFVRAWRGMRPRPPPPLPR